MYDDLNKQIAILEKLLKKPENRECIDCRRKSPSWASTTFGVFMCIKCSGFHRELSTSITKVKSVDLDKWPKGVVELYMKMNNKIANDYFEAKLDDDILLKRIRDDDQRLRDFIFDKYARRKWAKKGRCPMTKLVAGEDLVKKEIVTNSNEKEKKPEKVKNIDNSGKTKNINNNRFLADKQSKSGQQNVQTTQVKIGTIPVQSKEVTGDMFEFGSFGVNNQETKKQETKVNDIDFFSGLCSNDNTNTNTNIQNLNSNNSGSGGFSFDFMNANSNNTKGISTFNSNSNNGNKSSTTNNTNKEKDFGFECKEDKISKLLGQMSNNNQNSNLNTNTNNQNKSLNSTDLLFNSLNQPQQNNNNQTQNQNSFMGGNFMTGNNQPQQQFGMNNMNQGFNNQQNNQMYGGMQQQPNNNSYGFGGNRVNNMNNNTMSNNNTFNPNPNTFNNNNGTNINIHQPNINVNNTFYNNFSNENKKKEGKIELNFDKIDFNSSSMNKIIPNTNQNDIYGLGNLNLDVGSKKVEKKDPFSHLIGK